MKTSLKAGLGNLSAAQPLLCTLCLLIMVWAAEAEAMPAAETTASDSGQAPTAVAISGRAEPAKAHRYALAIGNAEYESAPLKTPTQDAQAVAKRLESIGFETSLLLNADRRSLEEGIGAFRQTLNNASPGTIALAYYAGRGLSVDGNAYFVPIGAQLGDPADVRHRATPIAVLLDAMHQEPVELRLLVLDTSLANPLPPTRGLQLRAEPAQPSLAGSGLSRVTRDSSVLILHAAEPGRIVIDSPVDQTDHSPLASAWLEAIGQPGRSLEHICIEVMRKTYEATGGRQLPWMEGSILKSFTLNSAKTQNPH